MYCKLYTIDTLDEWKSIYIEGIPSVDNYNNEWADTGFVVFSGDLPLAKWLAYKNPYHTIESQVYIALGYFASVYEESVMQCLFECTKDHYKPQNIAGFIGPMNGSTWYSYRFKLTGNDPAFFLEPQHPKYYPMLWSQAGFKPNWHYVSAKDIDVQAYVEMGAHRVAALRSENVSIEMASLDEWDNLITDIAEVSLKAFKNNQWYSPISIDRFTTLMAPMKAILKNGQLWLAKQDDRLLAYFFAIPDLLDQRGKTMIVKTIARDPGCSISGMPSAMAYCFMAQCYSLGIEKVIHALMFQDNTSRFISEKFSLQTQSEYALYEWRYPMT